MKKFTLIALVVTICLAATACSMRKTEEPTTLVTTTPTVMTMPTLDTNIPDPTVDSNSTQDGGLMGTTEDTTTDFTSNTTRATSDPTDDTNPEPKIRRRLFH